jgi:hypothetical protein
VSKFKLSLTRASDSYSSHDASQNKMKTKFKLLILTGPIASCSFKREYQIQAHFIESFRNKPEPSCMSKKNEKKIQTSHIHRANCQLQLQARVSKFKLSLPRASETSTSLDGNQKKNGK